MGESLYEILEPVLDEKHTELHYNGGFAEDDDPYDYIDVKEVVRHG